MSSDIVLYRPTLPAPLPVCVLVLACFHLLMLLRLMIINPLSFHVDSLAIHLLSCLFLPSTPSTSSTSSASPFPHLHHHHHPSHQLTILEHSDLCYYIHTKSLHPCPLTLGALTCATDRLQASLSVGNALRTGFRPIRLLSWLTAGLAEISGHSHWSSALGPCNRPCCGGTWGLRGAAYVGMAPHHW